MDKDLENGSLGSVGKYDVAFIGGQLVVEVDASVAVGSAGLVVKVSGKQILDALAAKIGGPIPAEVASLLEAALGL